MIRADQHYQSSDAVLRPYTGRMQALTQLFCVLKEHSKPVFRIKLSVDGTGVYSLGSDMMVFWSLAPKNTWYLDIAGN